MPEDRQSEDQIFDPEKMICSDPGCKRTAIFGLSVCAWHGGNSPILKTAVNARMYELIEPSLEMMKRCIERADWPHALKAASMILNRTGFSEKQVVEVEDRRPASEDMSIMSEQDLRERALKLAQRLAVAGGSRPAPMSKSSGLVN